MTICGAPHTPLEHFVPLSQPLPSLHAIPALPGMPPLHTPLLQVVPTTHWFADAHATPLLPTTATHDFCASLHDGTMHGFGTAMHGFGVPLHTPAVHVSLTVQKRLSLQAVPSMRGVFWQPATGSHVPWLH